MLDRFDQNELLALIEGELDEKRAEALRQELASVPEAWTQIEAMIADRRAMRSMPEPDLPRDLLSDLETHLARPMLMGRPPRNRSARPGHYRRARRGRGWRTTVGLAAGFVLVAVGGLWIAANQWPAITGGVGDTLFAFNDQTNESAARPGPRNPSQAGSDGRSSTTASLPDEAPVHHHLPSMTNDRSARASADGSNRDQSTNGRPNDSFEPLPFALVIAAPSKDHAVTQLESVLHKTLTQSAAPAALVRNFSFDEAQRIQRAYRNENRDRANNGEPAYASTDRPGARAQQLKELASNIRRYQHPTAGGNNNSRHESNTSGTLLGSEALAASLAQQLDYSSRGATHTITVPRDELIAYLEQLNQTMREVGAQTMLRSLPDPPDDPMATAAFRLSVDPAAWLEHTRTVQRIVGELEAGPSTQDVLLPVVIKRVDS